MPRETYDRWERDHAFLRHPDHIRDQAQLVAQGEAYSFVATAPSVERRFIEYVIVALDEHQEFDAGNALLWIVQENLVCHATMMHLARLLVAYDSPYNAKIWQVLLVKVCRSMALWLHRNDKETPLARVLWMKGLSLVARKPHIYQRDGLVADYAGYRTEVPHDWWSAFLEAQDAV